MAGRPIEREIDRLYQQPLDAFTIARNALAKTAGGDAARIKALVKPPLAVWVVNQVYWRDRQTYDALISASTELRGAHRATVAGKRGDIRAATREHEAAIAAALTSALAILSESSHRATEQTRRAVKTTLRALPGEEAPGRLTRTLQPGGFEMLAGLPIAAPPGGSARAAGLKAQSKGPKAQGSGSRAQAIQADKRAREAAAAAARQLREEEHKARRQEFERARAAREAEKATAAVVAARAAVEAAQQALAEAEAAATGAQRALAAAEEKLAAANARRPGPLAPAAAGPKRASPRTTPS